MALYLDLLGMVQAAVGKREDAQTHLVRLEAKLALLPTGLLPTAPIIICQALTALVLDDKERAASLYPHLLVFQGQHYWFLVDRVLGQIALLSSKWEEATRHLSAAEGIARREHLLPELAQTLLLQADIELRQANSSRHTHASNLLNQALALFEEMGMAESMNRVRDRLSSLCGQTNRQQARPTFPQRLTEREVAVLKLVAEGRNNRQIAQALCISEKTVANHLSHIFTKTQSENRAAATAFALRHKLV